MPINKYFLFNYRLKIVNDYIDNIATESNGTLTMMTNYTQETNQAIRIKYINIMPSTKKLIDTLRELHDTLCELSKDLNKLFGLVILLIIGRTFVVLVQQLYFLYLMFSQNDKYTLTAYKAWGCIITSVCYFLLVYIICFGCAKTKNEVVTCKHFMKIKNNSLYIL